MKASEQARRDANNGLKPRADIPIGQQAEYAKAYQDQKNKNSKK